DGGLRIGGTSGGRAFRGARRYRRRACRDRRQAFCARARPRSVEAAGTLASLIFLAMLEGDIFARRGAGIVHGEVILPNRRSGCDGKVRKRALPVAARNELDDFGA